MDLTGRTISHYTILEKLGEGGMGIVYRAHDTALDRPVALKFLPERTAATPADRERFIREARAAAGIDHPNVCTIYEVGETSEGLIFIAMALYDGETLQEKVARGALPIEEARAIAIQAAEGLRAAHERGIVHRDVKCSNIMVTAKGQVKIMDFGLAAGAGFSPLTRSGAVLGTVHCMSPEQARGETTDQRTDIWALGVVMYEMLTGRLPFRNDYPEALIYAILHETPPPLTELRSGISDKMARTVAKALAKNAAERFQSADELLRELRLTGTGQQESQEPGPASRPGMPKGRRIAAIISASALVLVCLGLFLYIRNPTAPGGKFIAVLPLENLSGLANDEPFCDGMTESIITSIAGVRGLSVIDRNSAFRYKHRLTDLHQIGRDLGVQYVLEGSVQRLAARLRVNAHLVNVESGFDLWAEKFDREVSDIFGVQDDIASRVVSALQLALTPGTDETRKRRPTSNMDAYDLFLRGKYLAAATDSASLFKSIDLLREATRLDPQFALAYAALGRVYAYLYFARGSGGDFLQNGVLATEKAIALDSTLAEGYATRGGLIWNRASGFAHEGAVREEQKALRLNPNLALAHQHLGNIYFHIGLLDESLGEFRTTLMLDPLNAFSPLRIARIYRFMGRYDSSLAQFGRLTSLDWSYERAVVLHCLGRDREAFDVLSESVRHNKGEISSDNAGAYAVLYAAAGNRAEAEKSIAIAIQKGGEASHFHHAEFNIACAYSLPGDRAKAVAWLKKTADDGMPCYPLFLHDPSLQGLRGDSAYAALMEGMRTQWEYFRSHLSG